MSTATAPASYDEVLISLGLTPSKRATPRAEPECGTYSGYNAHVARGDKGDEIDPSCREANRVYKAARFRARKDVAKLPPIKHGTPQGAQQHWYRRESACRRCLAARKAAQAGGDRR